MAAIKARILISACFLGEKVRYDGGDNRVISHFIQKWQDEGRLVAVCPEVAGGLSTPRSPAEIQYGNGHRVWRSEAQVIDIDNQNVTKAFKRGAQHALEKAQQNNCRFALLAANSPSCGNNNIYDGTFSGKLISGSGVTAALLTQNGITVFNQHEIEALAQRCS